MTILRELTTLLSFQVNQAQVQTATDVFFKLQARAIGLRIAYDRTVGTIQRFIDQTVSGAVEVDQLSKTTQLSTRQIQELGFAASTSGVSIQQLASTFDTLRINARAAERGGGGGSCRGFVTLVSRYPGGFGEDVKSGVVLFNELADAVQRLGTDTKTLTAIQAVAGGEGKRLIPLLLEGSSGIRRLRREYREISGEIESESIPIAVELNKLQIALNASFDRLSKRLARQLFPAIKRVRLEYIEWIKSNRAFIDSVIDGVAGAMSSLINGIQDLFSAFGVMVRFVRENETYFKFLAATLIGRLAPALLIVTARATAMLAVLIANGLAIAAPYIAAAAAVAGLAAVFEDLFQFVSGGQSALERYLSYLRTRGTENLSVFEQGIKSVLETVKLAVDQLNSFFRLIFDFADRDLDVFSAFGQGLVRVIDEALAGMEQMIRDFVRATIESVTSGVGDFFRGVLAPGTQPNPRPPSPTLRIPTFSTSAPSAGLGLGSISLGGPTVNVNVQNTGASAREIASTAKEAVQTVMSDQQREALRLVRGGVRR